MLDSQRHYFVLASLGAEHCSQCLQTKEHLVHQIDDNEFKKMLLVRLHKFTDAEVARVIEISKPTVARWREGKNIPHPAVRSLLIRILDELGNDQKGI